MKPDGDAPSVSTTGVRRFGRLASRGVPRRRGLANSFIQAAETKSKRVKQLADLAVVNNTTMESTPTRDADVPSATKAFSSSSDSKSPVFPRVEEPASTLRRREKYGADRVDDEASASWSVEEVQTAECALDKTEARSSNDYNNNPRRRTTVADRVSSGATASTSQSNPFSATVDRQIPEASSQRHEGLLKFPSLFRTDKEATAAWTLGLLFLTYCHASSAGFILPALLPSIAGDVELTDAQGALLTTLFTVCYSFVLPMAVRLVRWREYRRNRGLFVCESL